MVANSFWDVLKTYGGATSFLILTLISIVYLYTVIEDDSYKKLYRWIMISMVVCCYNPFAYIVIGKLGGKDTYYRFLWILASTIVISVAICVFAKLQGTHKMSCYIIISILVAICVLGGQSLIDKNAFKAPENRWKMDQDMVFAIDLLHELDEDGNIMTVGDLDYIVCARQYDASIGIAIGRDVYIGKNAPTVAQECIVNVTTGRGYPEQDMLMRALDNMGIEYIVVRFEEQKDNYLMGCGMEKYEFEGGYCVYVYSGN